MFPTGEPMLGPDGQPRVDAMGIPLMRFPMLNAMGQPIRYKERPLWLEPQLDEMGNIKKGPDGLNMMVPQGLPMLDKMGAPVQIDGRIINLIPMMEPDGKQPQMEQNGEPRMYPEGIPMLGAVGQPIMLDGKPIIMYPMLDP